ncbi:MAG: tRNA-guanine transglycosylase, partial [Bacteroidales bacterium]|nr:tRNA-guanine transglycosylase [Bacteroidales bacterium]
PTRNGRNGLLFTSRGTMNMKNQKWEYNFSPLDEEGTALVDKVYTKAYLRHLFKAQEILAMQIASIHNLSFYLRLVGQAREHIIAGDFREWKDKMVPVLSQRL